ncbi:hypothetical protein [Azospirillum sp. sgz301742]
MPLTDLDRAIEAYHSAERALGIAQRKGTQADKAAAAQAKRLAAQAVKDVAATVTVAPLPERQRRDLKRILDYVRLTSKGKRSGGEGGAE